MSAFIDGTCKIGALPYCGRTFHLCISYILEQNFEPYNEIVKLDVCGEECLFFQASDKLVSMDVVDRGK